MIEINLLPEDLKLKAKKIGQTEKFIYVLYFVVIVYAVVIVLHLYAAILGLTKDMQHNRLKEKWNKLLPQKSAVENFQKVRDDLSPEDRVIQGLLSARINWGEKLNRISLDLTAGIWFNELVINRFSVIIKGRAVSSLKTEMRLIEKFMDNLKKDTTFFKDFTTLELNSVTRDTVGSSELLDFVLTGKQVAK